MFRTSLQKIPFFLLTIPSVFLVHAANQYYRLLDWNLIMPDLIIWLLAPVLLYLVIGKWFRFYSKAGVFLFFFLLVTYFFHLLYDWLGSNRFLSFLASYSLLLPLILAGFIFLIIYLRKKQSGFIRFYYAANIFFILLLAGGLLQLAYQAIKNDRGRNDQGNPSKPVAAQFIPCDSCSAPDIYFLLFDGYTHGKTLQTEFNYDNQDMENWLLAKGFFIPEDSKSNYNFTHMSIGSEFNLDYLRNLRETRPFYTKDFLQAYYTVYQNELTMMLEKQGYVINNYSNFPLPGAPVKITPHLTELTYRSVLGQTFFHKLFRDVGWHLVQHFPDDMILRRNRKKMEDDIRRMEEVFTGVVDAARNPPEKPQFLYGHFFFPHETFYFDSSGNRLSKIYTARTRVNKKDYLNQLVYTNKFLIKPLVDSIFQNARRPSILIVQSDHGYRSYEKGKVMLEFDNLCAIYFPDRDYATLPPKLSSVNTFRIIMNKFFHQDYPLLKDSMINLSKRVSH